MVIILCLNSTFCAYILTAWIQYYYYIVIINTSMVVANFVAVERILEAKTVSAASPMAPACGLYLGHVKYNLPSET